MRIHYAPMETPNKYVFSFFNANKHKYIMINLKTPFLMITAAIVLNSCGSSSKVVKNYTPYNDISGLTLDTKDAPTLVYIRPGAPGLDAYDTFMVGDIILDERDSRLIDIDTEDLVRIRTYFGESLEKHLMEKGYEIGSGPSNQTLEMSFVLSGIKAPNASANVTSVILPIALKVGGITVEGSFKKSSSDRTDAVVISTSKGSRFANASPWSTWADVESALDQWAQGIANAVDKAHGK
ncbi:DUF3313 family protein [uncultured Allomuricauda sp.]|uniref:DUF3313 family protein n=1 Tax=Flagellimonas sp. W118 TaxID=3410791 RepID=UPI00262CA8C7|nr:DUF3313 family protein [uncultured Allomuricauda sp.]